MVFDEAARLRATRSHQACSGAELFIQQTPASSLTRSPFGPDICIQGKSNHQPAIDRIISQQYLGYSSAGCKLLYSITGFATRGWHQSVHPTNTGHSVTINTMHKGVRRTRGQRICHRSYPAHWMPETPLHPAESTKSRQESRQTAIRSRVQIPLLGGREKM